MRKGFLYLVAIMDWFSRKMLAWRISNTLEVEFCLEALSEAIHKFGPPEIMNTDQGSQVTSCDWTDRLKQARIKISRDGKARYLDNIFIERLWRPLKYECVYPLAGNTCKACVRGCTLGRPDHRPGRWRRAQDRLLQPPVPPRSPWRTTARRGLLQCNPN